MKKTIAIVLIALVILLLCGCNYRLIDIKYQFDYAMIAMPDGSTKTIELSGWADAEDGEQLTLTAKDGTIYLVSANNCVLIDEK